MISFEQAIAQLLASARPVAAERVALDDANGRVLAEDLMAPAPLPPFDYSSMDGYALAAGELSGSGPWDLPVVGESAAGGELPALAKGSACRIFTGARLPYGADAVIMQERVDRHADRVSIEASARPATGANVRRQGEDLALGAVALAAGSRMTPGRVALAAAIDRAHLLVARRPVVTVLATGDELRSPGTVYPPARPGSIPESNGYFVAAAGRAAGAHVRVAPFVCDDAIVAEQAARDALRASDVVITIGGVSVGDRDVMRTALEAAGVVIDFWKVKIKPGKPLAVGRAGTTHVIGLPGNPASASLTFLMFGVPLLRALQGDTAPLPPRLRGRLLETRTREPGRTELVRARLEIHHGEIGARPLPNQSSGAVTSFAAADCLAVLPAESATVDAGTIVDIVRLSDI